MEVQKEVKLKLNNNEVKMLSDLLEFARVYIADKRDDDRATWVANLNMDQKDFQETEIFLGNLFEEL